MATMQTVIVYLLLTWRAHRLLPSILRAQRSLPPVRMDSLTPKYSFSDLYADQLPPWLIQRAAALGFECPTPVQEEALSAVLVGRDAIVEAKTGSGKTLTYLLPLLGGLRPTQSSVQALVLLPTRELASQVAIVARKLAVGCPERLLVMALLDGSGAKRQRKWLLAEPPHVIVGNVQQARPTTSGPSHVFDNCHS